MEESMEKQMKIRMKSDGKDKRNKRKQLAGELLQATRP